jgi:hypothetical protein
VLLSRGRRQQHVTPLRDGPIGVERHQRREHAQAGGDLREGSPVGIPVVAQLPGARDDERFERTALLRPARGTRTGGVEVAPQAANTNG